MRKDSLKRLLSRRQDRISHKQWHFLWDCYKLEDNTCYCLLALPDPRFKTNSFKRYIIRAILDVGGKDFLYSIEQDKINSPKLRKLAFTPISKDLASFLFIAKEIPIRE